MKKASAVRDSGFELLRILSMFMIIILHISTHGINNYIDIPDFLNGFSEFFYYLIRSISINAVSLYVLISGYFLSKSKFKLSKLLKIVLETTFFSMSIYLLNVAVGFADFSVLTLLKSILSVFLGEYWFVTVYVVMYAMLPLLNKLINEMTKGEYHYLLITSFLVFNLWQIIYANAVIGVVSGYGLLYFMYLYFLAAYVRKYGFLIKDFSKNRYLIFFLLLATTNGVLDYVAEITFGGLGRLYQYNSPIVLLMSYCLFMYFKKLDVKNSKINYFSKYVFGIYLVHEQSTFRGVLWNEFGIIENIISSKGIIFIVKLVIFSLIIFMVCWLISFILTSTFNSLYKKINIS